MSTLSPSGEVHNSRYRSQTSVRRCGASDPTVPEVPVHAALVEGWSLLTSRALLQKVSVILVLKSSLSDPVKQQLDHLITIELLDLPTVREKFFFLEQTVPATDGFHPEPSLRNICDQKVAPASQQPENPARPWSSGAFRASVQRVSTIEQE